MNIGLKYILRSSEKDTITLYFNRCIIQWILQVDVEIEIPCVCNPPKFKQQHEKIIRVFKFIECFSVEEYNG